MVYYNKNNKTENYSQLCQTGIIKKSLEWDCYNSLTGNINLKDFPYLCPEKTEESKKCETKIFQVIPSTYLKRSVD